MPRKKSLFKGKPYWALKRDTESRETDTETAGPSTDLGQCPDEPVFVQTQLPVNEPEEFIPMIDTDTVQFVSEEGLLIIKNYKDLQEEEDVQVDIDLCESANALFTEPSFELVGTTSTPLAYRRKANSLIPLLTDDEMSTDQSIQSASQKKLLHVSLEDSDDEIVSTVSSTDLRGYRILGMESLATAVGTMQSTCHNANLYLGQAIEQQYGMATVLYFGCSVCHKKTFFPTSNVKSEQLRKIIINGKLRPQDCLDLNNRVVLAGLETGIGKSGVDRLADVLQLHYKGHSKMWAQKTRKMLLLAKSHARSVLSNARERVRRIILEENGIEYCQETPVEVAVSYDGTWSKRGFTANFGLGFVISVDSGQVLDFKFLSKVCPECNKNCDADDEWKERHKFDCQKNHQGTSKSMEVVAAQSIWRRSMASNIKYKWMVCDGDSSSYNSIWNTYGSCEHCKRFMSHGKKDGSLNAINDLTDIHSDENVVCNRVLKLDCIGHIQKRMGRSLLTWKQQHGATPWKKTDKSLQKATKKPSQKRQQEFICKECKRNHTLTNEVIKKLQQYYGKALRRNCIPYGSSVAEKEKALAKMQQSVLAVLYHSLLLEDDVQRHQYCPEQTEVYNWCGYKNETRLTEHQPHHLCPQYLPYLLPIFEKLSSRALLKRCLFGFSQNANECLNAVVWKRAPKEKNNSPSATHLAAISAVVQFNDGNVGTQRFYEALALPLTSFQHEKAKEIDKERVKRAEYKRKIKTRHRRQKIAQKKTRTEAMLEISEGPSYESGSFND